MSSLSSASARKCQSADTPQRLKFDVEVRVFEPKSNISTRASFAQGTLRPGRGRPPACRRDAGAPDFGRYQGAGRRLCARKASASELPYVPQAMPTSAAGRAGPALPVVPASPHFSQPFVARQPRVAWMRVERRFRDEGIVDTMLRSEIVVRRSRQAAIGCRSRRAVRNAG